MGDDIKERILRHPVTQAVASASARDDEARAQLGAALGVACGKLAAITTALDATGIQGGTPAERIERLASDRDSHMLAQAAAVAEVERLRADAVAARLSELETLIDYDQWRLAEQRLAELTEMLGASHPEIVGLTALLEAEKATGREPEA